MKNNEKLKNAFAAADEILFDPVDANAVTPSEEFIRKTGALVRKDRGAGWKLLNTTGKRVAAAALALLIVASAAIGVMALRGEDENILYRSENGDVVVRAVKPLEDLSRTRMLWQPVTAEQLYSAAEVFIGTIEKIDEVEITYEHMGLSVTSYRSLLTVSVDDIIKDDGKIVKGDTVKVVYGLSSYMTLEDGTYAKEGERHAFFLRRTSDKDSELDLALSNLAEYTYITNGHTFVPINEPQDTELLNVLGAEKETCGEAFIHTLKQFYSGDGGDGAKVLYRSENGDFVVRKVEPLENPIYLSRISMPISDEMINKPTDVVLGKITDVTEIFIETEHKPDDYYIEGVGYVSDLLRYRSLVSVEVKDSIKGDISAGDTVTFVFAVSSRNMEYTVDYRGKLPKVGDEYVLYLSKTSGLEEGNYYIPIADYYYNASLPCFVPYDEPQRPELLEIIGCEEGTCGEEFVVALKKYYE
ncbi:MAG: hypothetical protein J6U75_01945 [Clostridia bacterium]|nr:hypothetical protein [Clostridia bacterium]